jgi:hypothetical protein
LGRNLDVASSDKRFYFDKDVGHPVANSSGERPEQVVFGFAGELPEALHEVDPVVRPKEPKLKLW